MRGLSKPLKYRLLFLFVGNGLLLLLISVFLREGASFTQVLSQAGPDCAPIILAGLGMTGIILTGGIDLSIGSVIAVAGTVFGCLVYWEVPPLLCYLACGLTAWGLSTLNGALVRKLRLPAIIVTLAGLAFYRGVALMIADVAVPDFGGNLSVQDDAYHGPGKFHANSILLATLVMALVWEAFAETPRRWLALGNSPEACRLQGLAPGRILQSAFTVGGILLAVGALIEVTQVQTIEPARMTRGFELRVVGAVVLGGTNIFGGEGSFAGTVLGAFFLYFAQQLLIYAQVSPYLQEVLIGGAILLVIGADCTLNRRAKMLAELR